MGSLLLMATTGPLEVDYHIRLSTVKHLFGVVLVKYCRAHRIAVATACVDYTVVEHQPPFIGEERHRTGTDFGENWEIADEPIKFEAGNTEMIESEYKYDPRVTWIEDRSTYHGVFRGAPHNIGTTFGTFFPGEISHCF